MYLYIGLGIFLFLWLYWTITGYRRSQELRGEVRVEKGDPWTGWLNLCEARANARLHDLFLECYKEALHDQE